MQKRRRKKCKTGFNQVFGQSKVDYIRQLVGRQQLASLLIFPMQVILVAQSKLCLAGSGCQLASQLVGLGTQVASLKATTDNIQILGRHSYLASQINKARDNKLYYFILASCILGLPCPAKLSPLTSRLGASTNRQLAVYPKGLRRVALALNVVLKRLFSAPLEIVQLLLVIVIYPFSLASFPPLRQHPPAGQDLNMSVSAGNGWFWQQNVIPENHS